MFSLIKIAITNVIVGSIIYHFDYKGAEKLMKQIGVLILAFENLAFLATVMINPGMARRRPSVHSKKYLDLVRSV